jgi:DNA-binding XRE family transcriptional regulator
MTKREEAFHLAEARQLALSGGGRMLRELAGLNQSELARAVDVDQSTLWRWEAGERVPSGEHAIRYAKFLRELSERYSARRKVAA